MLDKIIIVTAPDDIHVDGIRVLAVDLGQDQTHLVSTVLTQLEDIPNIVVYLWRNGDDTNWLFDKKHKADIIVFNAESDNQLVAGYMAAQPNSYYLGILKTLDAVNNSAIYSTDQVLALLEKEIKRYDEKQ